MAARQFLTPLQFYERDSELLPRILTSDSLDLLGDLIHRIPESPAPEFETLESPHQDLPGLKLILSVLAFELKRLIREKITDELPSTSELKQEPSIRETLSQLEDVVTRSMANSKLLEASPGDWQALGRFVALFLEDRYQRRFETAIWKEVGRHLEVLRLHLEKHPNADEFEQAAMMHTVFRPQFDLQAETIYCQLSSDIQRARQALRALGLASPYVLGGRHAR